MHPVQGRSRFATLYVFFLKEFFRSRAMAVMFALTVGVAAMVFVLTYFEYSAIASFIAPAPTSSYNVAPGLKSLFLNYVWAYIGVLIPPLAASFYASPSVSGDFENGTIIPLFTLPVSRDKILFSRMLASFTAIALSMTLYEAIQITAVGLSSSNISLLTSALSYSLLLLYVFSCTSMAFAIGSFFGKVTHSTIVFLMVFYIVFNVASITLLTGLNSVPLYILSNAGGIVDRVFADLNPVPFFYGGSISPAPTHEIVYSAAVMLLYAMFFTLVSYLSFTKKRSEI